MLRNLTFYLTVHLFSNVSNSPFAETIPQFLNLAIGSTALIYMRTPHKLLGQLTGLPQEGICEANHPPREVKKKEGTK